MRPTGIGGWPSYPTVEAMKAALLVPRPTAPLKCSRCQHVCELIITFDDRGGTSVGMNLACGGCGPFGVRVVDLQPLFDIHQLWGGEAVPEVFIRHIHEIRAEPPQPAQGAA